MSEFSVAGTPMTPKEAVAAAHMGDREVLSSVEEWPAVRAALASAAHYWEMVEMTARAERAEAAIASGDARYGGEG